MKTVVAVSALLLVVGALAFGANAGTQPHHAQAHWWSNVWSFADRAAR